MEYEKLPLLINHFKRANIPVFHTGFSESAIVIIGLAKSSHQNAFMESLKQFTQRDFASLEEYSNYLQLRIEILEDRIL